MKGIWNRLRLALLGGILAFAGAGIVSPLAGGVVAEAASSDWVGKAFEKISSVDELQDGDAILLASKGNFAGSFDSSDYFNSATGSSGDSVVCTDAFEVFLLSGESGKFTLECDTLSDGSFVEYHGSSNKVYLTTSSSEADTWTFAYSSNKFRIQSGNVTGRYLQYNSGSPRFACYTGSQQYLDIYKFIETTSGEYVASLEVSPSSLEVTSGNAIDLSGFEVTTGGEAYEHYTAEIGTKTGDTFVARALIESGVTLYAAGDNCIRFTANDPISAEDDGHAYADVNITLTVPEATSVTVDPSEAETIVDGTIQLTATVLPVGASQEVTWSTENSDIVAVTDAGLVTGLKEGEATVVATTPNGKTGSATIIVSSDVVGQTRIAGNAGQTDVQGVVTGKTAVWEVADRFTLTQYQNSSNTAPNISNEEIRFYSGHTMVFAPSENVRITSIKIQTTKDEYKLSDATYENAKRTGSDTQGDLEPIDGYKAITIRASAQIRLSYIIVHWVYAQPVEFGILTRIEVNTAPTRLSYMTGDAASLEGLSVIAYDSDGNSEVISLDDEGLSITPSEGYVFAEKDVGDHQAIVKYTRGDVTVEAETTWTYHVEVLQTTEYVKATSVDDILLGDEIIIVGTNGGKTYAMGAQSGSYRGGVEVDVPVDGKITIADNVTDVARITIRVSAVAEGSLSLYDGEGSDEGYLASGNSKSNNLYTNDSADGNSSWILASSGDSLTLTAVEGNAEEPRTSFRFNYVNDAPRFTCYRTSTSSAQPHVEIYVRAHVAADQAAELARYMMEADTKDQCLRKFEIAKDAYLNRMGEDGRELFKTGDTYLDAKNRYEAWARHLGQLPYEEGAVQAFRFFNGNEGSMNWAIAGASLGIAVLGAAGYLFYRKKKVAR